MAHIRGDQVDTDFTNGDPYKIWEGKKRPKFSAIFDTVDFDHKYLRNGSTYRKSEKYLINYILSPIGWKKIVVVSGPNYRRACWPTQVDFFQDTKFRPHRGRWPVKFLHALDTGQGLLTHTTNRLGDPPQNFQGEHLQLGLKFHICARAYNFGDSGRNLTKLYQGTWLEAWLIKWTLILQGCPPTKFGRAKMSKIRRDFWQHLTLIANISGTHRHVENLNST